MYHIYAGKAETQENFNMDIRNSNNAESIIRGLIHEGYEVTIKEVHEKRSKNAPIPIDSSDNAGEYQNGAYDVQNNIGNNSGY